MENTFQQLQFFTGTILEWKKLLKPEKYKLILIDSFRFLTANKRLRIHAYAIMDNHFHTIWQVNNKTKRADVQRDLLKYTAQRIKADLSLFHPNVLEHFLVKAKDRMYQFWERNSLSVDLYTRQVFDQKLSYIHWNPVRAGLCKLPCEYRFSSANYFQGGIDEFGLLHQT